MNELRNQLTVRLQKKAGETFGFSLRRAIENGAEFRLAEGLPTLHWFVDVEELGHAYKASLRNEDRLIEINGQDVKSKSYKECARLLQNTGDTLALKVIRLSEGNDVEPSMEPPVAVTIERNAEQQSLNINIPDFLESSRCVYSIKTEYNNPLIVQCFEILKPHCKNSEGPLHIAFNTIVDEPLDANILSRILNDQTSPADGLTPYIVDSLKRHHGLNDITTLLSEVFDTLVDDKDNIYETLVDHLTKRMLLVQALENMSYDSQRFLCNFIQKNDLPIPFSYQVWNSIGKAMYHRINFNCLMETLCVTDLRLLLQFGSPSASGLGKTSLIGYLFDDKRRESFFTDATDCSWRDGCIDVLFADQFTIFDIHGKATDTKLIRSIQLYACVQIVYVTEEDLIGDFIDTNVTNTQTIIVVFDANYDDPATSTQLIKRFEDKFKRLGNILWTSAPMFNVRNNLPARKITQRNKRLRESFSQLLEKLKSEAERSSFRSCFQIQSSFYEANPNLTPIKVIFEVETELDHLFSSLSDKTENLLLVTPISYQRSQVKTTGASKYESIPSERFPSNSIGKDFSRNTQTSDVVNQYHEFTISLLSRRTYIELLIVEIYLEKWRAVYVPSLRQAQESVRETASTILRQLKKAERENPTSSQTTDFREQYEVLRTQLKAIDSRLMNVDLTFGLLCDELFALCDNIDATQLASKIEKHQNDFDLVATKLAELVYKGFALHVLRGRPLQSQSRLLKKCMKKLCLKDSVVVLTVIGEQSSAKSSLLNSTFGCNFRVSAGRCTIGLYLGLAYYKNITIMILDTEGLMSLEESGSIFDNQMVTMAVLSSNLVLVNHKGEISASLEGLIGMSLYAKIQIQSSPFKPKLLFVLRDQTQRDMQIFQQQLNRLKDNIQTNGEFLQMSVDDELEMKHIVLMPGAFTEDTNSDYGIIQKWRTKTFPAEINKLRTTVFKSLETQMSETVDTMGLRKNLHAYLHSKLTTNWKSIDDLGEGLLRCQNLYELSVQNELKSIAGSIIDEKQHQLQKSGGVLIQTLITTNMQPIRKNLDTSDTFKPHIWVQKTVKEGITDLTNLIDRQIAEAQRTYEDLTQQSFFTKVNSQWKNIEASIKNMQQSLYEELEMRAWQAALKTNTDYYRRELFHVKTTSKTSNECIIRLNQRVQELEIEITDSLQAYKRNKQDIIKSILDVYTNVIQTKSTNKHRRSTYNVCPSLDYTKYHQAVQKLTIIINKYVDPYIQQNRRKNSLHSIIDPQSPTVLNVTSSLFVFRQDNRSMLEWFNDINDTSKNERVLHFVFTELLTRINDRLNRLPLHLGYSAPKIIDELIEAIDDDLRSSKIDTTHINRPSFIEDIIIFTLHMLHEKTNQRFELNSKQLLDGTLKDLDQVKKNVLDQIEEDEKVINQAKVFRRILGNEIIREVKRIQQQALSKHIRGKLHQYCFIDPTDVTQQIYSESITSSPINPTNILKFIFDPIDYCWEQAYLRVKDLFQILRQTYSDEIYTKITSCMLIMNDVVLSSNWTDAYALHKEVFRQIIDALPGFQPSYAIEVSRQIEHPERFRDYFKNLHSFDGETDVDLLQQVTKVQEEFSRISSLENIDTLLYQSIGCTARCFGCGIKCELPAKINPSEEHHHYSEHHLPMAFNGWARDKQFHPHLLMCYQQWTTKTLFRGDNLMSSPKELFSSEAPDWYNDVEEKSRRGEACAESNPLVEHRRAWMAVRYKLIKEFDLRDQESYHPGIYPTHIVSVPNDFEVLWKSL